MFKKFVNWLTRPMTKQEERNMMAWNDAMCGIRRCPKCGTKIPLPKA